MTAAADPAMWSMISMVLVAVVGAYVTIKMRSLPSREKVEEVKAVVVEVKAEQLRTTKSLDGKMDALVDATRELAKLEGRDEERARVAKKMSDDLAAVARSDEAKKPKGTK